MPVCIYTPFTKTTDSLSSFIILIIIRDFLGQLSPSNSSEDGDSEIDSLNDDLSSNVSNNSSSKRQKRGILPKQATSVMRAWLFQHLVVSLKF